MTYNAPETVYYASAKRLLTTGLQIIAKVTRVYSIPYSRKYWRELNLAIEPKIAIVRILAVWYGIAIRIYANRKVWRILIWRL